MTWPTCISTEVTSNKKRRDVDVARGAKDDEDMIIDNVGTLGVNVVVTRVVTLVRPVTLCHGER